MSQTIIGAGMLLPVTAIVGIAIWAWIGIARELVLEEGNEFNDPFFEPRELWPSRKAPRNSERPSAAEASMSGAGN
jgi:hypothetical protein